MEPTIQQWARDPGMHHFRIINFSSFLIFFQIDTENIKLVFCAVKDTIMQTALKDTNLY